MRTTLLNHDGIQAMLTAGVSKSLLATLLNVSRPTLRRWLEGGEPLSDSMTRDANRVIEQHLNKRGT